MHACVCMCVCVEKHHPLVMKEFFSVYFHHIKDEMDRLNKAAQSMCEEDAYEVWQSVVNFF